MKNYLLLAIIICAITFAINTQSSYATEKTDSIVKEKQTEEDDAACKLEIDFTKIAEAKPEIDCDDDETSTDDTHAKHSEEELTKK
ncbi:MAG: hypothetical protein GY793_09900 [Proteobacteria bacterium]|nr:hypothetical protein [Pseudomonadota bacterium]